MCFATNFCKSTLLLGGFNNFVFTNIPHNEGVAARRYFLKVRQDNSLPAENICDLIRMIITMNNFSFNNEHYLQKHETAMKTRMAPSYANYS